MEKFEFLIGTWQLEYRIPKSSMCPNGDSGAGVGTFKRALNNKYVYFDYEAQLTASQCAAHAVFVWDEKINALRYWWFEDSGAFMTATCNFVNDDILMLNWHNSLLIQTFTKVAENKVILKMDNPDSEGIYQTVLEVILTR